MHKGSSPPQDTHANQSVHRFVVLEHSFGVFQLLWCPRSATMLYPSRMFSGEGFGVTFQILNLCSRDDRCTRVDFLLKIHMQTKVFIVL